MAHSCREHGISTRAALIGMFHICHIVYFSDDGID